jgi:hypothetical protein
MDELPLPYDIAAERGILGSCLLDRETILAVRGLVGVADFYLEKHALIYTACLDCFDDKVPPDLITVATRLRARGQLELIGGGGFLGDLTSDTPTAMHAQHYARIVAKSARSRRLIEHFGNAMARAYENKPDEAVEEAAQRLDLERHARASGEDWHGQMVDAVDVHAKNFPLRPFIIQDVLPVGVTILHALPKKRKSWLAKDFCFSVAAGGKAMGFLQAEKGEALYLNLEMDEELMNERLKVMYPNEPPPRGVKIFYEWPRMDCGFFDRLENYVTARPYTKLIVVDTMVRVFPDEAMAREGYRLDARMLEQFTKFNANRGLAIVLIHHSRKGGNGGSGNDPVLGALGSVGLSGSVDGLLQLEVDENDTAKGRLLKSGRRIKNDSPMPLKWDVQIGRWIANPRANELTPERRAVLRVVEERGPITPAKIAVVLNRPQPSIRRMCQDMQMAGQLINMQGAYDLPCDESQIA